MNEIRGFNVLSGANATLEWNGIPFSEVQSVNANVKLNRTDVQVSMSVDSKVVGATGELSLRIYHVYTRIAEQVLKAIKQGKDVRFTLRSRIADPDAVGGQAEAVVLTNVWLNDFNLINWERGNSDAQEYSGGFTPTDAQITESIKALAA